MPSKKKISPSSKAATGLLKNHMPLHLNITLINLGRRLASMRIIKSIVASSHDLLQRRPHRSFQRTYRRDYVRSLKLPGYWAFTNYVRKMLWDNKSIMLWLIVVYSVVTLLTVGLASEAAYTQVRDAVDSSSEDIFSGALGAVGRAGILVASGLTGAFNVESTNAQSSQQVFLMLAGLLIWLTTVWLLRAILAGRRPKLRDGLYNAGAPILPTFLVVLMIVVQLLPLAIAVFGYGAALSSGLLDGGGEAMLFWSVATLLVVLSLYWMTSTCIALVVVTLPGVYPLQAMRTAGDLVIGRRVRILLRLLWMMLILMMIYALIAVPIVLFDEWLKTMWPAISWLPLVPMTLLALTSLSVIWIASYIYLLYRKIVDDDALPA